MKLKPHPGPFQLSLGDRGEMAACDFLRAQGYQILEKNYKCKLGEIDVIANELQYAGTQQLRPCSVGPAYYEDRVMLGSVAIVNGRVRYTPFPGFTGIERAYVQVCNQFNRASSSELLVTVGDGNVAVGGREAAGAMGLTIGSGVSFEGGGERPGLEDGPIRRLGTVLVPSGGEDDAEAGGGTSLPLLLARAAAM